MVRFVYIVLIWILLLGLLQALFNFRAKPAPIAIIKQADAIGNYRLEITTTFIVEPDPFALITDSNEQPPALLVQLGGENVLRVTDQLAAGTPLVVNEVAGLQVGTNEFLIKAHPPSQRAGESHALRFQLLRGNTIIADHTCWTEPPQPLVTTVAVNLKADESEEEHDDH